MCRRAVRRAPERALQRARPACGKRTRRKETCVAEIPVERKSAIPWWAWFLLALLLLALVALGLSRCGAERAGLNSGTNQSAAGAGNRNGATSGSAAGSNASTPVATNTSSAGGTAGNASGAVTDISAYLSASDKGSLAGRGADFGSVMVQRVLSDRAFTVGPSRDQELFVMLDNSLNEGAAEKQVQIKEGQRLTLAGTFEKPPTAETAQERYRGLSASEAAEMKAREIYVHANRVAGAR